MSKDVEKSEVEKKVTRLVLSLALIPLDALSLMIGLDILEHYGFNVPTPGFWSSFIVAWAGQFIVGAVTSKQAMLDRFEKSL